MTSFSGRPSQTGLSVTSAVKVLGVPEVLAKLRGAQSVSRLELGKLNMNLALHMRSKAVDNIHSITGNLAQGTKVVKIGFYSWEVTSSSLEGGVSEKNQKEYAGFVENGTSRMAPRYYMRRAWQGVQPEAAAGLYRIGKLIEAL